MFAASIDTATSLPAVIITIKEIMVIASKARHSGEGYTGNDDALAFRLAKELNATIGARTLPPRDGKGP